jgi:ribonuclease-3
MSDTERRAAEIGALAARLEIPLHDWRIFDRALTHASLAGEAGADLRDYESLEFLGDAVLGLAAAHHLYETFPERSPGDYSRMRARLVNRKCVARVALALDLAPVIRLGKGEEQAGGRQRTALVSDCLEALIGALYLDSGWEAARDFVVRVFRQEFDEVRLADVVWDFKSLLQQHCQAAGLGLPRFEVVAADGPDHDKWFEVEVSLRDAPAGRGAGRTKKEAEQQAAKEALRREGQQIG